MQRARQQPQQQQNPLPNGQPQYQQQMMPSERITGNMGGRTGAIRESRIKDRPQPQEVRDSSLKIKIELDLEVEVDLYARVKGDVTIGTAFPPHNSSQNYHWMSIANKLSRINLRYPVALQIEPY